LLVVRDVDIVSEKDKDKFLHYLYQLE